MTTSDTITEADGTVGAYAKTTRTTGRRRDRMSYDRAAVHAVLDEALLCHVGFVDDEGQPHVIPMSHWRVGEALYLHGGKASRIMKLLAAGAPVCVTVTLLDGLVLARSAFSHSMNYRSVVIYGRCTAVEDAAEKDRVLAPLTDKMVPGRAAVARAPNAKELAATTVLALPLEEVSLKARTGGVADDAEDLAWPVWAGVLPLRLTPAAPEPDAALAPGVTAGMPAAAG